MKARKDTILFLLAIFALLLAGDVLWWQSSQLAVEYDTMQWATILPGGIGAEAIMIQTEQGLDQADAAIDNDLRALEAELNAME